MRPPPQMPGNADGAHLTLVVVVHDEDNVANAHAVNVPLCDIGAGLRLDLKNTAQAIGEGQLGAGALVVLKVVEGQQLLQLHPIFLACLGCRRFLSSMAI